MPGLTITVVRGAGPAALSCPAPAHYPVRRLEAPGCAIVLEGAVYDTPAAQLDTELVALGETLANEPEQLPARARAWLADSDGDFVVALHAPGRGRLAVFNDHFGRLPLYVAEEPSRVLITREIDALRRADALRAFDRLGIAETLLLLYPLGSRTAFAGVRCVPPATLLMIDVPAVRLEQHTLLRPPYDRSENPESDDPGVGALVDAFTAAAVAWARAARGPVVVSLSGGLDSRAVAAALASARVEFATATSLDAEGTARTDARIAEQVAQVLGVPWRRFDLAPAGGRDADALLRLKGGLNSLEMAYILPFLRALASHYADGPTVLTGDGGDKMLPDLVSRPPPRLLDRVVSDHAVTPPETVAAITRVPLRQLLGTVEEHLESLPERDPGQRWVHFLLAGRARRWLFEGEDRNRAFVWSVSPFYAREFARLALAVPDRRKRRFALYREFLTRLSPALARLPNASWGLPVSGWRTTAVLGLRDVYLGLPPGLRAVVRRLSGREAGAAAPPAALRAWVLERVRASPTVADHLDPAAIEAWLPHTTRAQLFLLLTLVATVQWVQTGDSGITDLDLGQDELP